MTKTAKDLVAILLVVQFTGCSMLPLNELSTTSLLRTSDEKSSTGLSKGGDQSNSRIANPPARTLRFDGHEILLGETESQLLDTEQLANRLNLLIQEQRFHTAATLVLRHRESAERFLAERWATGYDDVAVRLCAEVLSRRSTPSGANWSSLLEVAKSQAGPAVQYQNLRNAFAQELQADDPSNAAAEALMNASAKIPHPLVRVDALRLLGLRDLVAGRHAWAESQFRQAIEISTSSGNSLMAAEFWLMVAETARRSDQQASACSAWTKAVELHLSAYREDQPLDVSFWVLAEKIRPEQLNWPSALSQTLKSHALRLGCESPTSNEMVLWMAVANSQMERGEPQLALVNFKRAETLAKDDNVMWLRIAQAQCLAGMGQSPAAAAILSGPATSSNPAIASAAMAAMGSIKLKSGAFQQGAQLLHKATTQTPLATWPMRNQSLADLAIAQLIIGDTDQGLEALHQAQRMMEKSGDRSLLIQSLENELRLLEFEQRNEQCNAVRQRIVQLERL